ncbi:hypothetical protein C2W62_48175, partial [Candidatus Entotheonella serta]
MLSRNENVQVFLSSDASHFVAAPFSAENLRKYFPLTRGLIFMRTYGYVQAVDGLNFAIRQGETLGL